MPSIQKLKDIKIPKKDEKTIQGKTAEFEGYSQLSIISPKENAVITAGDGGSITVQLQASPALQAMHEVTLLLDGKKIKSGAQLQFQIDNLNRGSHLVQVQIKHRGKLLISSPKRRIHVQRPSILQPPASR